MTGRQLKIQGIGSTNEAFCEAMLGRMASMIPVPREHDYGIDFYCLPRAADGERSEITTELCGIQVKGGSSGGLTFGGIDGKTGTWRRHQIEWLRTLNVPFYLAVVDPHFQRVDLYSVTRCLQVFWKTEYPFQINCSIGPAEYSTPVSTPEPQPASQPQHAGHGDAAIWNVDLGAPFLSLSFEDLVDDELRDARCTVLMRWIHTDRSSLNNLLSGIPRVGLVQGYRTNELVPTEQHIMFWSPGNDAQAARMGLVLGPAVIAIGRHLFAQGKLHEALQWLGPLEWCLSRGTLDQMGAALLADLRALDSSTGDMPVS